jgi:hypothetical protein
VKWKAPDVRCPEEIKHASYIRATQEYVLPTGERLADFSMEALAEAESASMGLVDTLVRSAHYKRKNRGTVDAMSESLWMFCRERRRRNHLAAYEVAGIEFRLFERYLLSADCADPNIPNEFYSSQPVPNSKMQWRKPQYLNPEPDSVARWFVDERVGLIQPSGGLECAVIWLWLHQLNKALEFGRTWIEPDPLAPTA